MSSRERTTIAIRKTWRERAKLLKRELFALLLAYRDPRTPWYARLLIVCLLAYAFSPLDLIPDFIPVLGYLDDLILLPLGILLAIKLIPPEVMAESRARVESQSQGQRPVSWIGALVIVLTWLLLAALAGWLLTRWLWH